MVDGMGRPVGLLARNDLIRALKERGPHGRVADAMTILRLMARVSQYRAGSDHQNASQIAFAPFRDRPELLFAASGVFAWHEPDPGREVTPRSKNLRIRNGRRDRGCPDNTNSADGLQLLARLVRAGAGLLEQSTTARIYPYGSLEA